MSGNDRHGIVIQERDRHLLRELALMRVIDREQAKVVAGFHSTTSDKTLTSALYCLAADHLSGDIFKQFALKVDPIQDRLPPLRFEALRDSVAKAAFHCRSSHWFAHMGEGTH